VIIEVRLNNGFVCFTGLPFTERRIFFLFRIGRWNDLAEISGSIYLAAIVRCNDTLALFWHGGMEPSRMERGIDCMVTAEEAMVRNPIDAPFIPVKSSQGLKGSRVETRRLLHCTPPPLFGFK
jgi:hypothetical protein